MSASAVKEQILAALDDWAAWTNNRKRLAWLLSAARRADPDSNNGRFRDPEAWTSPEATRRLAEQALQAGAPAALLSAACWARAGMETVTPVREIPARRNAVIFS